jgi:putative component of membrane protein insertase Oxa1/YidC/SpoIIIJ protein YidD
MKIIGSSSFLHLFFWINNLSYANRFQCSLQKITRWSKVWQMLILWRIMRCWASSLPGQQGIETSVRSNDIPPEIMGIMALGFVRQNHALSFSPRCSQYSRQSLVHAGNHIWCPGSWQAAGNRDLSSKSGCETILQQWKICSVLREHFKITSLSKRFSQKKYISFWETMECRFRKSCGTISTSHLTSCGAGEYSIQEKADPSEVNLKDWLPYQVFCFAIIGRASQSAMAKMNPSTLHFWSRFFLKLRNGVSLFVESTLSSSNPTDHFLFLI